MEDAAEVCPRTPVAVVGALRHTQAGGVAYVSSRKKSVARETQDGAEVSTPPRLAQGETVVAFLPVNQMYQRASST